MSFREKKYSPIDLFIRTTAIKAQRIVTLVMFIAVYGLSEVFGLRACRQFSYENDDSLYWS